MLTATQILTGHECGILPVSWCCQDADLLLLCRRDNHALCWNPQTSEIIGEVCSFYLKSIDIISNIVIATNNGHLGVPSFSESTNPELLATAYFDGTIGIHTLQSTNDSVESRAPVPAPKPDGSDVFDVLDSLKPRNQLYHSSNRLSGYGGLCRAPSVTVAN